MEFIENKEVEKEQLKAIFKDMLKYSPSKLCGMLGNAIIVPVYTSLLSPEQYGLYSISIAMLSFLCILFSDWVGLSGLRFFRQHQLTQDIPKYLTTLVMMLIVNLSLMVLISFIFRHNFYSFFHVPTMYFIAILFLIIPVAIRALLSQLLRAQLKSLSFTITTILNQFSSILLSVFFVKFFHLGAMGLLLGMGVSISLIDLLLIYQSNILNWFRFQKIEWNSMLPICKYGIPIAATSLSAWIINQSNKFIMNSIHGFSQVGIVGVAYGLTLPLLMTIFSIITVAAVPRIINMYEEKIVISIYSSDYVHMLSSNEKFDIAFKLIPYFSFGTFFMALTDYTTLQYHLANKTYIDFIIKLISGITNIILNIMLIPKYGLIGVGIATLSANFLYFFLSIIIVLPGLRLKFPGMTLLKMSLSFIPFGCLYYIFNNNISLPALTEMILLIFVFYLSYLFLSTVIFKQNN